MTLEELRIDCRRVNSPEFGLKPCLYVDCSLWDELHRAHKTDLKIEIFRDCITYEGVEIRLDHAI